MDKPRIIGLGHKAQHGKDTVAKHLRRNYDYTILHFADHLKDIAALAFGFTDEQKAGDAKLIPDPYWSDALGRDFTPVEAYQLVGTEMFRQIIHPDFWVLSVFKEINDNPDELFVIADVRFPNEANAILQAGGEVYKVHNPRVTPAQTGRDPNHPSETALDNYADWNDILVNDDTILALYEQIETKIFHV